MRANREISEALFNAGGTEREMLLELLETRFWHRIKMLELRETHSDVVYGAHAGADVEGQPSARLLGLDLQATHRRKTGPTGTSTLWLAK